MRLLALVDPSVACDQAEIEIAPILMRVLPPFVSTLFWRKDVLPLIAMDELSYRYIAPGGKNKDTIISLIVFSLLNGPA